MDAGLEGYLAQLQSIEQDLPGIVAGLDDARFNWQPAGDRWAVSQCIEHVNITAARYLPVLRSAIADAQARGLTAQGPFALGMLERWFMQSLEPPVRRRFRTGKAFMVSAGLGARETVERFFRLRVGLA